MEVNDMGLTVRQRRFIEAYSGNAAEAARQAGYSPKWADRQAHLLLEKNREIAEAIRQREKERISSLIMSREQRQLFWSTVVQDESADMRDRLRASELLGKSEGDFLERMIDETPQEPPSIEVVFADPILEDPEARKLLSELYDRSIAVRRDV
jgi:phage terminase small subunit